MKNNYRISLFVTGTWLFLFSIVLFAPDCPAADNSGAETIDEETIARYQAEAEKGKVESMLNLVKKGISIIPFADKGKAESLFNLGKLFMEGKGVEKDYTEALKWFNLAAKKRYVPAWVELGTMYEEGLGVKKDETEAVRWYKKAADKKDAEGQNKLGLMYYNGRGVAKNDAEALKWIQKSAEQGYPAGQTNLGIFYVNGTGVKQDDKAALKWLSLGAGQGYPNGQAMMGWMYLNGRGVAKNSKEALKWFRLAAGQDYNWAKEQIKEHFNYDALDDDTPVTYEEHLKNHSLELLKSYTFDTVVSSGAGNRVVTPLAGKDKSESFTGMSVWEYDSRKETFVKHPYRFIHKSENVFPVALSWDGTIMAYKDDKIDAVVLVNMDENSIMRTIKYDFIVHKIAISRDNRTLALYEEVKQGDRYIKYLSAYSVTKGTQLARTAIAEGVSVSKMFYSDNGSLIVRHYNENDEGGSVSIYNDRLVESRKVLSYDKDKINDNFFINGINFEGDLLLLLENDTKGEEGQTKIFNINSGQLEKNAYPVMGDVTSGPGNRFIVPSGAEYILRNDKMLTLRFGDLDFRIAKGWVYVSSAESWFCFIEDRIIVMKPATDKLIQAMAEVEEGREQLKIGFYEPGAARIRGAVALYPSADLINETGFYAELADEKAPLRYIGEILLALYEEILKDEKNIKEQAITNAVERLRDYGLFASAAGHADLAMQAAGRIRFLEGKYRQDAPWDRLMINAVALEGLYMAATQSLDSAYTHILNQGGLVKDDYKAVVNSIINYRARNYWSVLYSDRKRLAYLLKMDISKVPTVDARPVSHQPYPDLNGRIIEFSIKAPDRIMPEEKKEEVSPPKARILD